MTYKVINEFLDRDSKKIYKVGEEYPSHDKSKTTKARLEALLGKNKYELPFIEEYEAAVEDPKSEEEVATEEAEAEEVAEEKPAETKKAK